MIDEAWRAIRDAAFQSGTRDATIPNGLAALAAILAVAGLIGLIDLIARRFKRRAVWRTPTRTRTTAIARSLIRPLFPAGSGDPRWAAPATSSVQPRRSDRPRV